MVRIRKKPSKRATTKDRAKIKHKVAESRHKQRKEAKKNPQWKSRHPKDPGIPSSLPFKAEILAEVEQHRRIAEEQKHRKKAAKEALLHPDESAADAEDETNVDENGADGVTSLPSSSVLKPKKTPESDASKPDLEEEDGEDVPLLVDSSLPDLKAVYDEADAIIHLMDARNPWPHLTMEMDFVSSEKKKNTMHVYTKIDLIPREVTQQWLDHSRKRQTDKAILLFQAAAAFIGGSPREGVKGKGKVSVEDSKGRDTVLQVLGKWASQSEPGEKDFTVAVIGLPNSGKSAFINTLLSQKTLPIYGPSTLTDRTTTPSAQVVTLAVGDRNIRIIDTPGVTLGSAAEPVSENEGPADDSEWKAYDLLVKNKGKIERAKDIMSAVRYLVDHAEREDLMLLYNTPVFASGDMDGFLKGVARSIGRLKRGGVLDTDGAAREILRDWSIGKILYCMPPPKLEAGQPVDNTYKDIYERTDQETLWGLKTRADFRRAGGFLRLTGEERGRTVVLEKWMGTDANVGGVEDDEDNEDQEWNGFGEDDADLQDEDEDDGDGDDEDDDETEVEGDEEEHEYFSSAGKRKRRPSSRSTPSPKKVAFAQGTKPPSLPSSAHKTRPKRVGNVGISGTARSKALKEGEEAYDFSRFF